MKNVIFDIGNVFIRWSPLENLRRCFPDTEPEPLWRAIHPDWFDLNLGKMTLEEALTLFAKQTGLPKEGFRRFCENVMEKAEQIEGMDALQARLKRNGTPLYCLSDNIKEVIATYHRLYPFMQRFEGAIISAEEGVAKPDPEIYRRLLDRYDLDAKSCLFFDDLERNVEGAKSVGLKARLFTDAKTCEEDLRAAGLL